jgi:hypothetical protein
LIFNFFVCGEWHWSAPTRNFYFHHVGKTIFWLLDYGRRKNKRRPLSTSSRRWCMKNIIDYSRHLPVLFPYGPRCLFT